MLALPLVFGVIVSAGLMLTQKSTYESSASLYVDAAGQDRASLLDPYSTPADNQAASLRELLQTKAFDLKVAQRSGLDDDLKAHGTGSGTLSLLLAKIHLGGTASHLNDAEAEAAEYELIQKGTAVSVPGPTIIRFTFQYRSAAITQAVAKGITEQFLDETKQAKIDQAQATVDFYNRQLPGLKDDVTKANDAVTAYVASHPETRSVTAVPDPTLADRQSDASLARTRYSTTQSKLDDAESQLELAKSVEPGGLRVMDAADAPLEPLSASKSILISVGGGLAAAIVVLIIAVVALTAMDGTVRHPREVEALLGMPLLATIKEEAA